MDNRNFVERFFDGVNNSCYAVAIKMLLGIIIVAIFCTVLVNVYGACQTKQIEAQHSIEATLAGYTNELKSVNSNSDLTNISITNLPDSEVVLNDVMNEVNGIVEGNIPPMVDSYESGNIPPMK